MTEEQREQCNALIQELTDAGIEVSLHEFRVVPGYRVVGMDGQKRRFQRDGEDPMDLLAKMKRLFGIKDVSDVPEEQQQPPH